MKVGKRIQTIEMPFTKKTVIYATNMLPVDVSHLPFQDYQARLDAAMADYEQKRQQLAMQHGELE